VQLSAASAVTTSVERNGRVDSILWGHRPCRLPIVEDQGERHLLNTLRLVSLSSCSTNLTGNNSCQVGVVTFDCFPVETLFCLSTSVYFGLLSYMDRTLFTDAFSAHCFFFFLSQTWPKFLEQNINIIYCQLDRISWRFSNDRVSFLYLLSKSSFRAIIIKYIYVPFHTSTISLYLVQHSVLYLW
jgi:hypothetical protein